MHGGEEEEPAYMGGGHWHVQGGRGKRLGASELRLKSFEYS